MTGPDLWQRGPRKGVWWHLVWCVGLTLWAIVWLVGRPIKLWAKLPTSVSITVTLWLMGWAGHGLSFWAWTLIAVVLGFGTALSESPSDP